MSNTYQNATFLAFLLPLAFVVVVASPVIRFLRERFWGQYIREDGPGSHHAKEGTPTAGGILILGALIIGFGVSFVLNDAMKPPMEAWLVLGVTLIFGLLGLWDDGLKILKKHNKGVSGYVKLLIQTITGFVMGWLLMTYHHTTQITFFHWAVWDVGILYPLFVALVIVSTSNAVNLTDGLDGLASGTVIFSLMSLASLFHQTWQASMSSDSFKLGLLTLILMGGTLGFLFYNKHPARIFMGDCGSLALGGAIGALTIVGHFDFWLVLFGGVFVLEALSVILQVVSFKTTGKRIFKMSPLHHHFELSGWSETKVVHFFIIFQFLLCVLTLFLYNRGG